MTAGYAVDSKDYSYVAINRILINYGVIGILALAIPGLFALIVLHRTVLNQQTKQLRNYAAFALALNFQMVGLSFIGGDNFNADPINIQLWTGLDGVFVCRCQSIAGRKRDRQIALEEEQERLMLLRREGDASIRGGIPSHAARG